MFCQPSSPLDPLDFYLLPTLDNTHKSQMKGQSIMAKLFLTGPFFILTLPYVS